MLRCRELKLAKRRSRGNLITVIYERRSGARQRFDLADKLEAE